MFYIETSSLCVLLTSFSVQRKTGLPISTYFSAVKLRWMLDNVDEVRQAVQSRHAMFGTVDSWIIWVSVTYVRMFIYDLGRLFCCSLSPAPDGGQQRRGALYRRDKRQSYYALQHSHHGLGLWTLQVSNTQLMVKTGNHNNNQVLLLFFCMCLHSSSRCWQFALARMSITWQTHTRLVFLTHVCSNLLQLSLLQSFLLYCGQGSFCSLLGFLHSSCDGDVPVVVSW